MFSFLTHKAIMQTAINFNFIQKTFHIDLQPHKTVLEKHGKPDDALPGVKGGKERLPHQPLSGMYNKSGGRVRLTFKLEQDQLWIGTKGRFQC